MKCCICGDEMKDDGNNAEPLGEGRCCDYCNDFVILARLIECGGAPNQAVLLKTDDTYVAKAPSDGKKFQLEELQGYLGGYIEVYPKRMRNHYVLVNEEGLLWGLPQNRIAKDLLRIDVVGDVILIPKKMFE